MVLRSELFASYKITYQYSSKGRLIVSWSEIGPLWLRSHVILEGSAVMAAIRFFLGEGRREENVPG